MLDIDNSLIICVDIQEKLLNAVFNKDIVDKKSCIISKVSKILNIPFLITEQYPKGLGATVDSVKNNVISPFIFEKTSFNAFDENAIKNKIVSLNKKHIVLMGIETHICVYQTVCALLKEGFDVTVIKDACGSRNEEEHITGLHNMERHGADIKTTEMILFEFLKSSKHPNFKEIQTLIK